MGLQLLQSSRAHHCPSGNSLPYPWFSEAIAKKGRQTFAASAGLLGILSCIGYYFQQSLVCLSEKQACPGKENAAAFLSLPTIHFSLSRNSTSCPSQLPQPTWKGEGRSLQTENSHWLLAVGSNPETLKALGEYNSLHMLFNVKEEHMVARNKLLFDEIYNMMIYCNHGIPKPLGIFYTELHNALLYTG